MEKVFENINNEDVNAEATFNPTIARYVKVVFNVIATDRNLTISEIEVYGEGFLPEGVFYSNIKTLPKRVNFSTFEYGGDVPNGTTVDFSFRTGDSPEPDTLWSEWSEYSSIQNSLFSVYEPRQYRQYRVKLTTSNLFTPQVDYIRINYDTANVASVTSSKISPQFATILTENGFTLSVTAQFAESDHGIDTLRISTPSPVELLGVT